MNVKSIDAIKIRKKKIPATRPVSDELFVYAEDYLYKIQILIGNTWHSLERFIPKGFLTDKRSIPKPFRWLRPRDGLCELAALGHDPDYRAAGYTKNLDLGAWLTIDGVKSTLSRKACDKLYKYTYDAVKPNSSEPERDYFWLRCFGWSQFGKREPPAAKKLKKAT